MLANALSEVNGRLAAPPSSRRHRRAAIAALPIR